MIRRTACVALMILALAAVGVLHASEEPSCTITVSEGSSIQSAIDAAPSGAVICLEAGTWQENLIVRKSLILRGAGADSSRVIAMDEGSPVIDIRHDADPAGVSLIEVVVTSLSVSGGMTGINIMGSAEVRLLQMLVEQSRAFGIYASDGQLSVQNSTIRDNAYSGLLIDSARATVSDCHVLSNLQNGIYLLGHWDRSTISLVGNRIAGNAYYGVSLGENFVGLLTGQDNVVPDTDQPSGNEIAAFSSDELRFLATAAGGRLGDQEPVDQPQSTSSPAIEIAYDDDTSEGSLGWGSAGRGYAVRFSPPEQATVLLTGARLFINGFAGGPAPIRVHVWDALRSELIPPITVTPTDSGWLELDLSGLDLLIEGEDFYVGYTQTSASQYPWIGKNSVVPTDRSYNLPDWSSVLPPGTNIMIRAVVEVQDASPDVEI